MQHATLYKRSKTGAIQQWTISVGFDATKRAADIPTIFKVAGQVGGKLTEHQEPVLAGKNIGKANETTPLQQAESQALADWTKKHDDGYKSLKDLDLIVVGPTPEAYLKPDVKKIYDDILLPILDEALPKFNTGSSGSLKPMKAPTTPWKRGKKLNWPQQYEPKLDGNRATLIITDEGAEFRSSGDKVITTLDHLVTIAAASTLRGKFDGEVYRHGWTLRQINKAIRKVRDYTPELNFHIFDIPDSKEVQTVRTELANDAVNTINSPKFPSHYVILVHNEDEVVEVHDNWVQIEGYEGGMLKDPNGTYQPGQRSSFWNKVKMFDDAEFEVVGYELGQRGVQDLMFVCLHEGRTFNPPMNGTIAEKQELLDNMDMCIGAQLTVRYFGFTDLGVPNIAKGKCFRDED